MRDRIDQARRILALLTMPRAQQNDRTANFIVQSAGLNESTVRPMLLEADLHSIPCSTWAYHSNWLTKRSEASRGQRSQL